MPVRERQMPYDFSCMLNIMNKLNNKQNTDRLRQRASGQPLVGGWEVKVVDGSSKKEGLMDMVDNVETAGRMQVGGGGEGYGGINGNGKKYNKQITVVLQSSM